MEGNSIIHAPSPFGHLGHWGFSLPIFHAEALLAQFSVLELFSNNAVFCQGERQEGAMFASACLLHFAVGTWFTPNIYRSHFYISCLIANLKQCNKTNVMSYACGAQWKVVR
jgi:hypothetical protein